MLKIKVLSIWNVLYVWLTLMSLGIDSLRTSCHQSPNVVFANTCTVQHAWRYTLQKAFSQLELQRSSADVRNEWKTLFRLLQSNIRWQLHNFTDANPFPNSNRNPSPNSNPDPNPRSVLYLKFQFRFLTKWQPEASEILFPRDEIIFF